MIRIATAKTSTVLLTIIAALALPCSTIVLLHFIWLIGCKPRRWFKAQPLAKPSDVRVQASEVRAVRR